MILVGEVLFQVGPSGPFFLRPLHLDRGQRKKKEPRGYLKEGNSRGGKVLKGVGMGSGGQGAGRESVWLGESQREGKSAPERGGAHSGPQALARSSDFMLRDQRSGTI